MDLKVTFIVKNQLFFKTLLTPLTGILLDIFLSLFLFNLDFISLNFFISNSDYVSVQNNLYMKYDSFKLYVHVILY